MNGGVPSGSLLTNVAVTSTSNIEDPDVFTNRASRVVRTPFPDPAINKRGDRLGDSGHLITWELEYRNNNNEDAAGVYILDTLFDVSNLLANAGRSFPLPWMITPRTIAIPLSRACRGWIWH